MRRLISFILIGLAAAAPAGAHGIGNAAGALHWVWEPWVLFCLAVTAIPYLIGLFRMRPEERRRIVGPARAASFLAGIGILLIALESPLDGMSDALFSAHMVQHLLLLLIVPPLLVTGRPVIAWLWAFDLRSRRAIVRTWGRLGLYTAFQWLTRPMVVWLLWVASLCFWHLPGPYGWAVRHEWLHDLEHLSFLGFALAYWSIVIEPYGRRRALSYGATMIYVVSTGFTMGLVAAILTLAPHPLYAVHLHTTQAFGLTPLEDQQLAGAIMWIPSNMIHLTTICALFFAWMRDDERRAVRFRSFLPDTAMRCALVVPLVLVALSACSGKPGDPPPFQTIPGANAQHGAKLINHYGCGACHMIPGISGADGLVGPPLIHWSERSFIAGLMRNNPQNLMHWIEHPQQVVPGVDMPDMGVTPKDARDIAAYLYTIH